MQLTSLCHINCDVCDVIQFLQSLPTRTSEQVYVIGVCVCKKIVISRTRDLIYLKLVTIEVVGSKQRECQR